MTAIGPVALGQTPALNFENINAAIAEARKVSDKQDAFDLANLLSTVSTQVARLRALTVEVDGAQTALSQLQSDLAGSLLQISLLSGNLSNTSNLLAAQRFDYLGPESRPGDAPAAFSLVTSRNALGGDGRLLPAIPQTLVQAGDSGRALRLTGAAVVAQRQPVPIEQGRVYRARFVIQRRANPSDPSNDSVVLAIVWLDAGLNVLAPTNDYQLVEDVRDLSTAYGRQERAVLFSRSQLADAQFQAPLRARYARAYVQTYGLDGVTDVEVLGIEDVSLATVLAPETVDTVQRVSALESQDLGPRVTVLENQANAPNSVTFATKSDAAGGTIPDTVTTVSLRGLAQAGDGGDGIYKRISGTAAPGSDSFTNQGITFVRVFTNADVLGALLNSLPTSLPPVAGRAWLNGDTLAVS